MTLQLLLEDIRHVLLSKRTTYTIILMALFAFAFAIIAEFSPEGLKMALEAGVPGSSGLFEYLWFVDLLDKFFLLVIVSFGAFILCDLEDDGTVDLQLSKSGTRIGFVIRRAAASLISFFVLFMIMSMIAGIIAWLIVGDIDIIQFLAHHIMVLPMCLFVFSLTFFISVPLRQTTPTVIAGFAIALALSFLYTFLAMAGDTTPTILNPLALGYRIQLALPLAGAILVALVSSAVLFSLGTLWFWKKDV